MPTYNTSIETGGFGSEVPGQIAKLRKQPARNPMLNSLFSLSPYQKARINPQQSAEMSRHASDTSRAASWDVANDLDRNFNAANEDMRFKQLGAATNQANSFFNTANNAAAHQREIDQQKQQAMMSMVGSIMGGMGSMFGGGGGGGGLLGQPLGGIGSAMGGNPMLSSLLGGF